MTISLNSTGDLSEITLYLEICLGKIEIFYGVVLPTKIAGDFHFSN